MQLKLTDPSFIAIANKSIFGDHCNTTMSPGEDFSELSLKQRQVVDSSMFVKRLYKNVRIQISIMSIEDVVAVFMY